jgi:hydroxyethylthiazole kinase-like uncharacterized protein yjeF
LKNIPEVIPDFRTTADAFVVGPGTDARRDRARVRKILKKIPAESPLLIDGGALLIWRDFYSLRHSQAVLTPHEGELSVLLNEKNSKSVAKNRFAALKHFSENFPQATVLLKGSPNLVFSEGKIYEISWGSVAMATAGQGDMLAGVIGAYLAMGLSPLRSVILGVSLCGLAADSLARGREPQGVLAHEVADILPKIIAQLRRRPSSTR